jgi:hypothetical protein
MSTTPETFHAEIFALKEAKPENNPFMSVICETSQISISPYFSINAVSLLM